MGIAAGVYGGNYTVYYLLLYVLRQTIKMLRIFIAWLDAVKITALLFEIIAA
jgi:hypothetical protein